MIVRKSLYVERFDFAKSCIFKVATTLKSVLYITNRWVQPGNSRTGNPGFSEAGETMQSPEKASPGNTN